MLRARVIPILLFKNNGLYKGVRFKNHRYVGDPINAVRIFNEKEVDELILLDITASCENRKPDFEFIAEVASECFMPLVYGGGINSFEDVQVLFSLGVEKIALNSAGLSTPTLITDIAEVFGSQSVIVAIDVKRNYFGRYEVYSHSGTRKTEWSPIEWAKKAQSLGAGELLITAIDQEGTMRGYDIALAQSISKEVSIPIILAGGAANLNDFKKAVDVGVSAVAAGAMFIFYGEHKAVLIQYPSHDKIKEVLHI